MKNWQKVMEFCDQSCNLPILTLNFTKFVLFLLTLGNFALVYKVCIFRPFLQNVWIAGFELRDSHGKLRDGHEKFMEKISAKFVGTL